MHYGTNLHTVIIFLQIYQLISRELYAQLLWFNYKGVHVNSKYINGVIFKCVWTSCSAGVTGGYCGGNKSSKDGDIQ